MKYTQNFNMKIPEGGDPIDISDITGNFETLDEELSKKASSSGGDISSMTVKTLDTIATEFPVPSAGESSKTFMGKVRKFIQDFNNIRTELLTLGQLVNNGQTTEPGFALDARYGKTLYDLYAQLNANMGKLPNRIQMGEVWVTPSAPNVVTSVYVPFSIPFPGSPIILLTARTAGPGSNVLGIGFTNENQDGFTLHTMRNNTQEFSVTWVALY